jgi:pyruvate formate lyase activating enzyme
LIPGENDSDEELDRMTRWVAEALGPDVPIHFTAFHPDYKLLDKPPTPPATLSRARRIAMGNGLRYAYTGNVHDAEGGSTFCHNCGERLIGRDWYVLKEWNLTPEGACASCGTPLPGRLPGGCRCGCGILRRCQLGRGNPDRGRRTATLVARVRRERRLSRP